MKKSKPYIEILEPKIRNCQDSFFYDGDIAYMRYGNRHILIIACGDIRINQKVDDGYEQVDLDNFKCDKDLKKVNDKTYTWENNNWFEILYKKSGEDYESLDECYGGYDEVMKIAQQLITDNREYYRMGWDKLSDIEVALYEKN